MASARQSSDAPLRGVAAEIHYLGPDSPVNRRFVAPGVEVNTGTYVPHRVEVRDARPVAERFTLDRHGFVLARHASAVGDFFDKTEVDAVYPDEVVELVRSLTGATFVAPLGWMVRTSGDLSQFERETEGYTHQGGVQPPAGEAHVDMMPARAETMARELYERLRPDGPGFERFIASSLWRCFSEPPQDWPLALCEAASVDPSEGVANTMFIVDELPDAETMVGPMPDEDTKPAAAVFRHSPNHRWWYFSNMRRDEVLLFKFHDSDRGRALRVPHTAFRDPSFSAPNERRSIEFRTVAFFE